MKAEPFHLKRLLIEATTIVLSILLAFWIDASWTSHNERLQIEKSLVALQSNFNSYFHEIDRVLAFHEERERTATILATKSANELLVIQVDSILALLRGSSFPGTTDLQTVGVSSMVASNQISKLENTDLRQKLAEWDAKYRDYKETEANLIDYLQDSFRPYINSRIVIPWGPENIDSRSSISLQKMFTDITFQNHAILLMVQSITARNELGTVRALTEEILELIDEELGQAA